MLVLGDCCSGVVAVHGSLRAHGSLLVLGGCCSRVIACSWVIAWVIARARRLLFRGHCVLTGGCCSGVIACSRVIAWVFARARWLLFMGHCVLMGHCVFMGHCMGHCSCETVAVQGSLLCMLIGLRSPQPHIHILDCHSNCYLYKAL
eukprot:1160457-Pelagomonas_calceolata.AAC.9